MILEYWDENDNKMKVIYDISSIALFKKEEEHEIIIKGEDEDDVKEKLNLSDIDDLEITEKSAI